MSIQLNNLMTSTAQTLEGLQTSGANVARQSENSENIAGQNEVAVEQSISAPEPQYDTVEISAEGMAALAHAQENAGSTNGASETVTPSTKEPATDGEVKASQEPTVQQRTDGTSTSGSTMRARVDVKKSGTDEKAAAPAAPVTSSSDSVDPNNLSKYSKTQLAKFARDGQITWAQYNAEMARREESSSKSQ